MDIENVVLACKKLADKDKVISDTKFSLVIDKFDIAPDDMPEIKQALEPLGIVIIEPSSDVDDEPIGNEDFDASEDGSEDIKDKKNTEYSSADDSTRQYLKEIGSIPLLSPEEETELAKAIAIRSTKLLENAMYEEQLAELSDDDAKAQVQAIIDANKAEIVAGDIAKETLTNSNLRLVVSIAKRYLHRGLSFLDLIQEGNIGLMKAVDRFDYTKGYKFSTYATWWIRQAITRAIADSSRNVRLPVHVVEQINKVIATQRMLSQSLGHDPSPEEISEATKLSPDKIRELLMLSQDTISINTPVGEDGDSSLIDFIECDDDSLPDKHVEHESSREYVLQILRKRLSDRELEVIYRRFGFFGKRETLDEIGITMGVTRERIRQIESKAIRKLSHSSDRKMLLELLKT